MSELFGRRWRVQVGTTATADLRVEFKITRTRRPAPGTCELTVYNLNADHRAALQGTRRTFVRVEAGYVATGTTVLFQGDSRRIKNAHDGATWTTKVTAGDGEHAIRTARASRSFGPGTRLEEVVRHIATAMGVGAGNVAEQLAGASFDGTVGAAFPGGALVHGNAARELTRLLTSANLEWSVQSGVLQVLPRGGVLTRQAVRLAAGTGLVGSPELGQHGTVKAKALLIPDLVPGRLVRLESAIVTGVYCIDKVEYAGDSHGTDWYADLELRARA